MAISSIVLEFNARWRWNDHLPGGHVERIKMEIGHAVRESRQVLLFVFVVWYWTGCTGHHAPKVVLQERPWHTASTPAMSACPELLHVDNEIGICLTCLICLTCPTCPAFWFQSFIITCRYWVLSCSFRFRFRFRFRLLFRFLFRFLFRTLLLL